MSLFREVTVWVALTAALAYLVLYWRNPHRTRGVVSNMLLHLGIVQVLVYFSALLRFYIFPHFDVPAWVQVLTSATINLAAMSLTIWVLVAYLHVRHQAKNLDTETEQEWER